jgi:sulfur transfer protein SufE
MKSSLKRALKYAGLLACLVICTHGREAATVMGRQRDKPITKANLNSSLKLGRAEGMTAERYVGLIKGAGVAFSLARGPQA